MENEDMGLWGGGGGGGVKKYGAFGEIEIQNGK